MLMDICLDLFVCVDKYKSKESDFYEQETI